MGHPISTTRDQFIYYLYTKDGVVPGKERSLETNINADIQVTICTRDVDIYMYTHNENVPDASAQLENYVVSETHRVHKTIFIFLEKKEASRLYDPFVFHSKNRESYSTRSSLAS